MILRRKNMEVPAMHMYAWLCYYGYELEIMPYEWREGVVDNGYGNE